MAFQWKDVGSGTAERGESGKDSAPRGLRGRFSFHHVGTRLAGAFALILAILLGASALVVWQLWRIEVRSEAIARDSENIAYVGRWAALVRTNLERALIVTRIEAAASDDEALRARLSALTGRMVEEMAATAAQARQLQAQVGAARGELADLIARIENFRSRFVATRDKVREDVQMGEGTGRIEAELMPLAQGMLQGLDELAKRLERSTAQRNRESVAAIRESQVMLAAAGLLALLATVALAWRTTNSITVPVRQAAAVARGIAAGDLSQKIESSRADEIGALLRDLAQMQQRLNGAFQAIRASADALEAASRNVAGGSAELSTRTEEASSSLQQTAASMEQLAGTVRQTAEAAATASDLAQSAADVARNGSAAVSKVVTTMDEINAGSKRIADIIGLIDAIAFQTNILALNAAVEAARAGEQGRGFAVVATEVRALAQRSAGAAKEVKAIIASSGQHVSAGSKLVRDAGRTMDDIVTSSQRVTDIIREISSAAKEESAGIGQVNVAVSELDRMTQQNATFVVQGAAAAEDLKAHAHKLAEVVADFRLSEEAAPSPDFQGHQGHMLPREDLAPRMPRAPGYPALRG